MNRAAEPSDYNPDYWDEPTVRIPRLADRPKMCVVLEEDTVVQKRGFWATLRMRFGL